MAPESFTTLAHLTISTFTSRVDRRHSGRLALRASALTGQCAQLACAGAPNGIVGMRAWLVACRLGADLAADVADAARLVVDHDLLAERFTHLRREGTRQDVKNGGPQGVGGAASNRDLLCLRLAW